jgi:PAS domain S-box-containing protein
MWYKQKKGITIKKMEGIYNELIKRAPFAFAYHKIIYNDSMEPVDYLFLDVNRAFEELTGLSVKKIINRKASEVTSGIFLRDINWHSIYVELTKTDGPKTFEFYEKNSKKWYRINAGSNLKDHFITYYTDISEEKLSALTSKQLLEQASGEINYDQICQDLLQIAGAKHIAFNLFEENGLDFTTVGLGGIPDLVQKAFQILGFDPRGHKWSHDPLREEKMRGKMLFHFASLSDLTHNVIPRQTAKSLEILLQIGEIIVVKIVKETKALGDFTIIMGKGEKLRNSYLVEIYAHQVGMVIERYFQYQEIRNFFYLNPDLCSIIGRDGNFRNTNPSWESTLGYTSKELTGYPYINLVHPDDRPEIEYISSNLNESQKIKEFTNRYRHKDGSYHYLEWQAQLWGDRIFSIAKDVSQRKKNEESLRRSSELHRQILETAMDGIWLIDRKGNFLEVNETACTMSGYSQEELLTMNISQIEIMGDDLQLGSQIEKIIHNKSLRFESIHRTKNGQVIEVEISSRYLAYDGEKIVVFVRDITEQKKAIKEKEELQQQLLQTQKLESIGQLAGGIAHDFNNQLSGILGYAELLSLNLEDETLSKYAEIIQQGAQNGAKLTQQLLAFARKGQYKKELIDLNDIINETVEILSHTIDKRIQIIWEKSIECPTIQGDHSRIQNALLNITLNGRDAIKGAGTLKIETTRIDFRENESNQLLDLESGSYICIKVSDNGSGMEKSVQERIFEPFFTTKDIGKGTGMGLPAAYGTVKHLGGDIFVESNLGVGSDFYIYLPFFKAEKKVIPPPLKILI